MAEIIEKTGKSYNIFDKINNVWNKCSFWTHSNDVFYPDGKSATTKHGAINGITSDLTGEAEDIAASIKCVNQLNSSLIANDKQFQFAYNSDKGSYGYMIDGTFKSFSNATALYEALQYSGLVTEDMSYDQMLTALKNAYPQKILFMGTPSSHWIMSGYTVNAHNNTNFIFIGVVNVKSATYTYNQNINHALNGKTLKIGGSMYSTEAVNGAIAVPQIKVQASVDGTNWVDLYSVNGNAMNTTSVKTFSTSVKLSSNYKKFRLYLTFSTYQQHLCDRMRYKITTFEIG